MAATVPTLAVKVGMTVPVIQALGLVDQVEHGSAGDLGVKSPIQACTPTLLTMAASCNLVQGGQQGLQEGHGVGVVGDGRPRCPRWRSRSA